MKSVLPFAALLSGASAALLPQGAPSRRSVLGAAAALSAASLPAVVPLPAAALPPFEVSRKLSRVPVFVVTNRQESPYLTERDEQGRRSGSFFIGPQEALRAYNDIKQYDPAASLSVLPLDSVYFDLSATQAEAALAPQPTAGTSTDMKLFVLRPLAEELQAARRFAPSTPLRDGAIPLFYDPQVQLEVDGRLQRPFFFRSDDLRKMRDAADVENAPALDVRVATLSDVVRQLQEGQRKDVDDILLVAASEAAAVVDRMGMGDSVGSAAEPDDPLLRTAATTPFAKGRM